MPALKSLAGKLSIDAFTETKWQCKFFVDEIGVDNEWGLVQCGIQCGIIELVKQARLYCVLQSLKLL